MAFREPVLKEQRDLILFDTIGNAATPKSRIYSLQISNQS